MAPQPPAKARRYRRILTSVHHRRFVLAFALTLLACYVVSFFIGTWNSFFWSWCPFGPCGIRTIFLLISCSFIAVLRAGQMHVGERTANSLLSDMRQTLFSCAAVNTLLAYVLSAWVFGEVYRWSCPSKADLNWVKPGRPSERAILNERPIYLHCFFFMLAIAQAYLHLGHDYSRIPVTVASPTPGESESESKSKSKQRQRQKTHATISPSDRLLSFLPHLAYRAFRFVSMAFLVGPLVYVVFLRRHAWQTTLYFARFWWNFSRSSAEPPSLLSSIPAAVNIRAIISGFWLVALWQWVNMAFSTYWGQPPLKKDGKPLTDGLKDANVSLINGLHSKQELVKTFAFWELCLISQDFPERRQQIFADLDNDAWKGIFLASKTVIEAVNTRIEAFKTPHKATSEPPKAADQDTNQQADSIKDSSIKIKQPSHKNVLADPPKPKDQPEKFEAAFSSFAKSHGQADDWTRNLRSRTQDLIGSASKSMLSPERKKQFLAQAGEVRKLTFPGPKDDGGPDLPLAKKILRSKFGVLFRQTYRNRITKIVFGAPHADVAPLIDAIVALSELTVDSLEEDKYGFVQRDVAEIVKLFTETITRVHEFNSEKGLKPHWTDVGFPSPQSPAYQTARKVQAIDALLSALRSGLMDILKAFKDHLSDVGLTPKDVRLARQATGLSHI